MLLLLAAVLALFFHVSARTREAGSRPMKEPDPGQHLVVHFGEGKKMFSVKEAERIDGFVDRNRGASPDGVFYIWGISRNSFSEEMQLSRDRVASIRSYLMRRFRISRGYLLSKPDLLLSKGQAPDSLANCVIIEFQ